MKSISGILEVQKLPFFAILEGLNFDCDEFLLFLRAEIYPKSKLSVFKNGQNCTFWGFEMTKISFTLKI